MNNDFLILLLIVYCFFNVACRVAILVILTEIAKKVGINFNEDNDA